jgi:hypothetical protein
MEDLKRGHSHPIPVQSIGNSISSAIPSFAKSSSIEFEIESSTWQANLSKPGSSSTTR